ncbi:WAT1-related protein At5g40240-like [Prosopis cineraria]|uniref:WAT1-related protein At5g40240-like n=1 Tax=Prosopis cineraria TaxID=364024 RepID=UPI00240F3457|nr:WAT1-related protein At5g40240-like [Prosopis cineraria]
MGKVMPFLGMVIAILSQTGSQVVIKIAMNGGIDKYVLIFYSYALSFLLLVPFIFLFRRSQPPPLTFPSICRFFLLALFGFSATILAYVGIDLSSPTLATALFNLVPAFTFVLALIFRMEVVDFREYRSQAKVLGTIVSIGGAFVVIFYKGPPIFKNHSAVSTYMYLFSSAQSNWVLGGFYCATDSFLTSLWYIYQVGSFTFFEAVIMVVVLFQIFFSTIMSAIFALIVVTDPSAWVLRLDMGLVSIFHQAVVATVIRFILCTWCVQKAGPLFCTMFKPIGIIFTVIMGALFLGDDFHLGSLVGAVIIVLGFYAVMWGKGKEERKVEATFDNLDSSCHSAPLLQNKT